MLIDFDKIPEVVNSNFKGGDIAANIRAFDDGMKKIMRIRLERGASIGQHTHTDNSEIFYCLSGKGEVVCNGETESLSPGQAHYCPNGCTHTLRNIGDEDLVVFAIVG